MSGLSFSDLSIFMGIPIMFISLSCLLLILFYSHNKNYLYFFSLGSVFSFGQLLVGLYWISFSFDYVFTNGIYLGLIAIICLAFVLSTFYGLSCIIISFIQNFWQFNILGFAILFSTFLSLSEYLRGNVLGGFPWNIIGYIWSHSDVMMQTVSIFGIYGLGLVTLLAGTSIALVFHKIRYGFYTCLPILLCALYGIVKLNMQNTDFSDSLQIRVVQPSISQDLKWDKKLSNEHLDKLINLSLMNNNTTKPQLIIWPESSLPYNSEVLENNIEIVNWLDNNQVLIAGVTRTEFNNNQLSKIFNSAFITDKFFNNVYYDKVKLVPFGEFNPLKNIFNFDKITDGAIDFSEGNNNNLVKIFNDKYKIGVLICYEIIFPGAVVKGETSDFIVNITNDAWYGNTYGPLQHLAAARARAIEEGVPIIRAANTGISAVINEYGQYIERLELGEEGVIDINLPLKKQKTIFSFLGNYLYLISLIFMLMLTRFTFISKNLKQRK